MIEGKLDPISGQMRGWVKMPAAKLVADVENGAPKRVDYQHNGFL